MRIPPSVIVMSLLTAVPFGLAMRDTHRGRDKVSSRHELEASDFDETGDSSDSFDSREYRESAAKIAEVRAEEREHERARQAKTAAQRTKLAPQLVGAEPASLGSLFAGVRLGASAGNFQPDLVREQIADASDVLDVDWDVDAAQLNGVAIRLKTDDDQGSCAPFASALRAWGPATGDTWQNATTHQRAKFDELGCSLKIERYADVDHWLDRSEASIVPMSAIGQLAGKLRARLADRLDGDDETSLSWQDVGPAGSFGRSRLSAIIEAGKVVTIEVDVAGTPDIAPIVARLNKLYGTKGKPDDDLGGLVWSAGKLQAVLNESNGSLVIGKQQ
jgi:hypothetical protein